VPVSLVRPEGRAAADRVLGALRPRWGRGRIRPVIPVVSVLVERIRGVTNRGGIWSGGREVIGGLGLGGGPGVVGGQRRGASLGVLLDVREPAHHAVVPVVSVSEPFEFRT